MEAGENSDTIEAGQQPRRIPSDQMQQQLSASLVFTIAADLKPPCVSHACEIGEGVTLSLRRPYFAVCVENRDEKYEVTTTGCGSKDSCER